MKWPTENGIAVRFVQVSGPKRGREVTVSADATFGNLSVRFAQNLCKLIGNGSYVTVGIRDKNRADLRRVQWVVVRNKITDSSMYHELLNLIENATCCVPGVPFDVVFRSSDREYAVTGLKFTNSAETMPEANDEDPVAGQPCTDSGIRSSF